MMQSGIVPFGLECGTLRGKMQQGSTVAIVGTGPTGFAALPTTQCHAPGKIILIDLDDNRPAIATMRGAADTINSTEGRALATVMNPSRSGQRK